jgi:hypothetical protein
MKNLSSHYKIRLERKIRRMLRRTDWIAFNAEDIFTAEQVQEAKIYRQALRDMDKNDYVFPEMPLFINPLDLEE